MRPAFQTKALPSCTPSSAPAGTRSIRPTPSPRTQTPSMRFATGRHPGRTRTGTTHSTTRPETAQAISTAGEFAPLAEGGFGKTYGRGTYFAPTECASRN